MSLSSSSEPGGWVGAEKAHTALAIVMAVELRPVLQRALLDPVAETDELRNAVREVAIRAMESGYPAPVTILAITSVLEHAASDRTPYFNLDQVRERITVWTHSVYRGR
jgi:hypothetical protein